MKGAACTHVSHIEIASETRLQPHGIVVIEIGGLRTAIDREFAALRPEWLHTQDGADCVGVFRAGSLK